MEIIKQPLSVRDDNSSIYPFLLLDIAAIALVIISIYSGILNALLGFPILLFIFFPGAIGLAGLIMGIFSLIFSLRERQSSLLPVVLIIASLIAGSAPEISLFTLSKIEHYRMVESQKASQEFAQQTAIFFNQRYSTLHQVKFVHDSGTLVLENGDVIGPTGIPQAGEVDWDPKILLWEKSYLLGKQIQITSPSYQDQDAVSCSAARDGYAEDVRKDLNLDPEMGGICSIINAKVLLNGKSISDNFITVYEDGGIHSVRQLINPE